MNIAITSDQNHLGGSVPELFEGSPWLLIADADSGALLKALEWEGEDAAMRFARAVLDWDCECILCGEIERAPFVVIADEGCVTRYKASGLAARKALRKMLRNELDFITDYIGGTGCAGHDHAPAPCGGCG